MTHQDLTTRLVSDKTATTNKRKAVDEVIDLISDDDSDNSATCTPSTPAAKRPRKEEDAAEIRRILSPINTTLRKVADATRTKIPEDRARLQVLKAELVTIGKYIREQSDDRTGVTIEEKLWEHVAEVHWPQPDKQGNFISGQRLKSVYEKMQASGVATAASTGKEANDVLDRKDPPGLPYSSPEKGESNATQPPITPKTPAQSAMRPSESQSSPRSKSASPTQATTSASPTQAQEDIPPTCTSTNDPPPTTPPTNRKPPSLHSLPVLAPHHLPRTSTASDIVYTNPSLFSLSPPLWRKWTPAMYASFAAHLRTHFDPIPLSRQFHRPVEEIQHVFSALVVAPLEDAREATRRGEAGMREIREAFCRFGAGVRGWGSQGLRGWIDGVEEGAVRVVLEDGTVRVLGVGELRGEDRGYLKGTLTEGDWGRVSGRKDGGEDLGGGMEDGV